MLQPKKTKYRKQQKGKMKGLANRGHELSFGSFGIKSLDTAFITGRQIEAARQAVSSPLLETSINGATDAIINITGGVNLTLFEAEQAAEVVRSAADNDINTIFGSVINENLSDEVIVTVIATGFDKKNKKIKNEETEMLFTPQESKRRTTPSEPELAYVATTTADDEDDGEEFELPPFLQNRNF